jgi:hypothetical protein
MGKFLGRFGVELRGVSVGELSGLFGHRAADFGNAVADGDDRSTTGSIEKALASRSEDKTSFAANGLRIRLQEISRKNGVTHYLILDSAGAHAYCTAPPELSSLSANLEIRVTATMRRGERIHNGE